MKHLKETAQRTANALLAFILAFSFCPIAPSAAIADEGGLQAANASGLTAGSSSFLTEVAGLIAQAEVAELTAQAEGDAAVYDWASLQEAINKSTADAPVVLARDIVAGKDDESLRIEDWNQHALDLNGHTIDRNCSAHIASKLWLCLASGTTIALIASSSACVQHIPDRDDESVSRYEASASPAS